MKPNSKKLTKHHIIAKREKDKFHTDNAGTTKLPWYRHFGLHQLFRSGHPQGQLQEFKGITDRVMSDEAKSLLQRLIDLPLDRFYKKELVKKKKK